MVKRYPIKHLGGVFLEPSSNWKALRQHKDPQKAVGFSCMCPNASPDNKHQVIVLFERKKIIGLPDHIYPGEWTHLYKEQLERLSIPEEVVCQKCTWRGHILGGDAVWLAQED